MTWDDVTTLAQEFPETALGTAYGTPALRVRGKLLTRLRPEDDSLVLLAVPVDERDMLIEADPTVFHTTPHYDGYPAVLARLEPLDPVTLRRYLERRWRQLASKRAAAQFDRADE